MAPAPIALRSLDDFAERTEIGVIDAAALGR
jgi:hypothetical protein